MAFPELQIEEILAGMLLFYTFSRAANVHGVDPDLLLLPYIHGSTVPHPMETCPDKPANDTPSSTACTPSCAHTLNTAGLDQQDCVLLENSLRISHPWGTPKPLSDSLLILYPVSINSQKSPNAWNPFRLTTLWSKHRLVHKFQWTDIFHLDLYTPNPSCREQEVKKLR